MAVTFVHATWRKVNGYFQPLPAQNIARAPVFDTAWFNRTVPSNSVPSKPSGVRAIVALFTLCAVYLAITGALMLMRPGMLSMAVGAPLLFGLALAGPYMFLLAAFVGGTVAWGLSELNNIARRIAILIAIVGVVMLVPAVSAATVMVHLKALAIGGLGIIVRVMVVWYLSRQEIAEEFKKR